MKYLYNPVTGALDDVETPKLGEKYFASAETDEIIKQINDQFGPGTLFPASEAPQPENPYKDFTDRNPAANGGMMRQNYAAGPLILPPAMLYGAGVALGIGSQIKGENVLEQSRILKEHISENSDDPKVQALLMSLGIVTQDVKDNVSESVRATGLGLDIGPDADEIEETKPIILSTPIESYEGSFKDQGLTIPEPEKQLPNTGGKIDVPISEGMDIAKTGPITLNNEMLEKMTVPKAKKKVIEILDKQEKEIPTLKTKKDTEKFIKSIETKIDTLPNNQFYKEPVLNEKYIKVLGDYIQTHYNGNVAKAKAALDLNIDRKSFYNRLVTKYPGFKASGQSAASLLDIKQGNLKYTDAITAIKTDSKPLYVKFNKLIKNKTIKKNDYLEVTDLANFIGMDGSNAEQRHALTTQLRKLDIRKQKGTQGGKARAYHIGDVMSELTSYANDRQALSGEGKKTSQYEKRKTADFNTGLTTLESAIRKDIKQNTENSDIAIPKISLGEDKGHAESILVVKQYPKLFKNSNIKDLGTLIKQDPEINQEILMREGYHNTNSAIYKKLSNKKINKDEANVLLKENFNRIQKIIKTKTNETLYLRDQGNRVPLLQVDQNGVVQADMSTVDNFYVYGNINEINPNAKKVSDLSKEEINLYMSNIKTQYIDSAVKFLTNLKDDKTGEDVYSKEEIENYVDMLSVKPDRTKRKLKYDFKAGGVIPDQEIMNYANGGRINYENGSPRGPNEPEGDSFLNELEFKFNNIDDVTLDDTPITYDDSKSKIAQFNDLLDIRNIPYYADMAAQAALRVGEFGARILPATGNLISDILQKPMFKVKSSYLREGENEILDYGETTKEDNVKFVGGPIFKNFLKNITPTSTEKLVGLDTLINEEKKKMIERGSSSMPVKVAETASLGAELIAPIFPGLKIIKAYASAKGVKPTKEVAKTIEQEIDAMAKAKGMNRREFLTATGAVSTIALAKLLGISSELPKVAKTAEAVTSVAKTADGVPQYLYDLKNVIRLRGQLQPSSSAFLDGQEVYTYKGVTLYHNTYPKDGSFRIAKEFETDSIVPGEPSYNKVEMEVNKGGDIVVDEGLETQKVVKAGDEYEEATAYPSREGGEDVDFYVEDDFHKQLEEISKELDEINQKVEMFGYDK